MVSTTSSSMPRGRHGPGTPFPPRPSSPPTIMWAMDKFLCSCSAVRFYCEHIQEFFANQQDVGLHTVISKTTAGQTKPLFLPLADGLLMECRRTVVEHPAVKGTYMLYVEEPTAVSMHLDRLDGFDLFIRAARDYYRSTAAYAHCSERIRNRKRLYCVADKHDTVNDRELVARLQQVLALAPQLPDDAVRYALWDEVALENAYTIVNNGMCNSCFNSQINPDKVPDDLIPKI